MTALVLGCDPGAKGALALLSTSRPWQPSRIVDVIDMPEATGSALGTHLRDWLADHSPHTVAVAWVEQVHSMPGQGVASTFKFGANYGSVLGALGAMGIPVELRTPSVWKKAMRVTADKGSSRQAATQLWPERARDFSLVKHDGRAEACLLAEYGWRAGR